MVNDRRNARKGVGEPAQAGLLKGRANPWGNPDYYWSSCIAKVVVA